MRSNNSQRELPHPFPFQGGCGIPLLLLLQGAVPLLLLHLLPDLDFHLFEFTAVDPVEVFQVLIGLRGGNTQGNFGMQC